MIDTTPVNEVGFRNEGTFEESLARLHRAAASNGVSPSAVRTLLALTSMGHGLNDVVGMSAPTADLKELESLKLIYRAAPGRVDLV